MVELRQYLKATVQIKCTLRISQLSNRDDPPGGEGLSTNHLIDASSNRSPDY
jgi:hypothetical protein